MGISDVSDAELDARIASSVALANGVKDGEPVTSDSENTAEQSETGTDAEANDVPEKAAPKASPKPAKKENKEWRDRYYSTAVRTNAIFESQRQEIEALKAGYDPEQISLIEKIAEHKIAAKAVEVESQREIRGYFRDYPDFAAHKEGIHEVKESYPNMSIEKATTFYLADKHPELLVKKVQRSMWGAVPSSVKTANTLDVMNEVELRAAAMKDMSRYL